LNYLCFFLSQSSPSLNPKDQHFIILFHFILFYSTPSYNIPIPNINLIIIQPCCFCFWRYTSIAKSPFPRPCRYLRSPYSTEYYLLTPSSILVIADQQARSSPGKCSRSHLLVILQVYKEMYKQLYEQVWVLVHFLVHSTCPVAQSPSCHTHPPSVHYIYQTSL
jgi:hypothetical protein